MEKIILGGGISGFIAKYFHPEFKIISPDVGGQLNMNYFGPKVLHKNKCNKLLLDELGLQYEEKEIVIKYLIDGHIEAEANNEACRRLRNKKMNDYPLLYQNRDTGDIKLSIESNRLCYYDIDINEVFNALVAKVDPEDIIRRKAILISSKRSFIVLDDYSQRDYSFLISTIPATEYEYLCFDNDNTVKLKYLPVTYLKSKESLYDVLEGEWLYICDNNSPITRVSRQGDNYVYEITGFYRDDCGINYDTKSVQRVGVIYSDDIRDTHNTMFLGRLSVWNHSIKLQDVIVKMRGNI